MNKEQDNIDKTEEIQETTKPGKTYDNATTNIINATKDDIEKAKDTDTLTEALKSFKKFNDFEGYVDYRKRLLDVVNSFFEKDLEGYSQYYVYSFHHGMVGEIEKEEKYSEEERKKFYDLLVKKSDLIKKATLQSIELGLFDNFLNKEELHDFKLILESRIFNLHDDIFYTFKKSCKQNKKNYYQGEDLIYKGKLMYGVATENGETSYIEAHGNYQKFDFSSIQNKHLRDYFSKYQEILLSKSTNYDDWIELASYEMQTWKDKDSKIGIIGGMENYELKGVLIDPELEIFIKKPAKEYSKKANDLSLKYYANSYNMRDTNYSTVEPFISSGTANFKYTVGKNFHNDQNIKSQFGVYGYSLESRIKSPVVAQKHIDNFIKVVSENKEINIINTEEYGNYIVNMVWQHEYGHNQFKTGDTQGETKHKFEETKADLYSLLFIYDTFKERSYSQDEARILVQGIITNNIRRFVNPNQSSLYKYVLSSSLQIQKMFEHDLIKWGKDGKLEVDINLDNFGNYLDEMKDFLFFLKEVYEKNDVETENKMIEKIESDFKDNLQKITTLLNAK